MESPDGHNAPGHRGGAETRGVATSPRDVDREVGKISGGDSLRPCQSAIRSPADIAI
jgi:hypothetical protein